MGEYIRNHFHVKRFPRISLVCKLVPVQYREYEYGLSRKDIALDNAVIHPVAPAWVGDIEECQERQHNLCPLPGIADISNVARSCQLQRCQFPEIFEEPTVLCEVFQTVLFRTSIASKHLLVSFVSFEVFLLLCCRYFSKASTNFRLFFYRFPVFFVSKTVLVGSATSCHRILNSSFRTLLVWKPL